MGENLNGFRMNKIIFGGQVGGFGITKIIQAVAGKSKYNLSRFESSEKYEWGGFGMGKKLYGFQNNLGGFG